MFVVLDFSKRPKLYTRIAKYKFDKKRMYTLLDLSSGALSYYTGEAILKMRDDGVKFLNIYEDCYSLMALDGELLLDDKLSLGHSGSQDVYFNHKRVLALFNELIESKICISFYSEDDFVATLFGGDLITGWLYLIFFAEIYDFYILRFYYTSFNYNTPDETDIFVQLSKEGKFIGVAMNSDLDFTISDKYKIDESFMAKLKLFILG